jgi:hypothetical protein
MPGQKEFGSHESMKAETSAKIFPGFLASKFIFFTRSWHWALATAHLPCPA